MDRTPRTTESKSTISSQEQLYEFVARLNRAESLDEVFNAALDAITAALKVERSSILIYDDQEVMRFKAWRGLSDGYRKAVEGHSPWSPDDPNPVPVVIEDVAAAPLENSLRQVVQKEGICALAFIPLICKDKLLGKFMIYYDRPHVLKDDELQMAQTIGYPLASAVERKQAEEALHASEERYRVLVEGQAEMICRFRSDGTILFVNRAYARACGKTPEALIHTSFWNLVTEADRSAVQAMLDKLTPDAPEVRIENRFRGADGERWTLWTNRALVFDAEGRWLEAQSSGIDITERKRVEDLLEFQKYALDQSSIVAITDVKGTITYVNHKFCQISGYSPEELIGQNHRIINSSLHPTEFFREMYRTISKGKVWRGEIRNRRKDGSFYWVDTTIVPSMGSDGRPEAYVAIRTDITERKQIEMALEFQKYALDQSSIVAITDVKGTITYVNDKFCQISGYSREELIGQNHRIINSGLHPTEFFREMYRTISKGKVWRGEIRNRRKDGSFYWVDTTIVPSLGPDGRPERYVAIRNDITERKQAEDALKKLNLELERKVKERTIQLEQQSDRLRLLAEQLTTTEQIERKRIAALIHDHLQQILVAGKFHLHQAIKYASQERYEKLQEKLLQSDEFLNEAMRAAKSLTAELRPPVLYEGGLVAAIQWLANKYREEHNINTVLELQDVPELDDNLKILIFELVRELLFNVIKHAQVNDVLVRMRYSKEGDLYLCVIDKGAGFDVALKEKVEARGFGLFHIRERLKLLGADLKITSAPRCGTNVEIFLPLKKTPAEEISVVRSFKGMKRKRHGDDKTITILMADDHRIVREGIVNLLKEQQGFEVIAQAENGFEAVEKARMLVPDVVIMDINMPKLSGIEATRIIKSELPNVRIIGLSVQDEIETIRAMKAAGAETLLNKAEDPKELISTIRK